MHRIRTLLALVALLPALVCHAQFGSAPPVSARQWLLVDFGSGQELAGNRVDERIEPASLTKLMTAYLTFAALREGRLKPDQSVTISEYAWRAPGSRMFVDPKHPVKVSELIRGMIVQSGNDASIALAETIAGSEAEFVRRMNNEARRQGLSGTHFANATGLPEPAHYSTARDLARLARALIRDFPDQYPVYSVREYGYNGITQPNRNRLLWLDPTVDGMKTGHTETAGYCLVASARRGTQRLISVILGTDSDATRAEDSLRLLNYGFQNFDAVRLYAKGQPVSRLQVFKGSLSTVAAGFGQDFVVTLPKGSAGRLRMDLVSRQPLMAPVPKGAPIATLKLYVAGQPWGEYPVFALEEVPVANIFGRAWDSLRLFFE